MEGIRGHIYEGLWGKYIKYIIHRILNIEALQFYIMQK